MALPCSPSKPRLIIIRRWTVGDAKSSREESIKKSHHSKGLRLGIFINQADFLYIMCNVYFSKKKLHKKVFF